MPLCHNVSVYLECEVLIIFSSFPYLSVVFKVYEYFFVLLNVLLTHM